MQKLKGQSGETIIETLVRYSDPAVQQTGAVQLTFTEAEASAESKQVDITLYKSENDYYWYRSERRGASRTG